MPEKAIKINAKTGQNGGHWDYVCLRTAI